MLPEFMRKKSANDRPVHGRDVKSACGRPPGAVAGVWRWGLAALGLALAALLFLPPAPDAAAPHPVASPTPAPATATAPSPRTTAASAPAPREADVAGREITVRRGDSLALIFRRAGLSAQQVHEVMHLAPATRRLRDLRPGDRLTLAVDAQNRLRALEYRRSPTRRLVVRRGDDGLSARVIDREPQVRTAYAGAVIEDSLFVAGQRAGLPDSLIMELAHIFGWDIDFALDIRPGDRFTVLYERRYLDGRALDDGEILAAEFVNRGRTYRALRYTDPRGRTDYYTPDGHSMRKAFIRTPVAFTRISSRFSLHRRHPILHRSRRHVGVDYAAPVGTPVRAAGDGRVVFVGRKGGYGRTVILDHGRGYTTLYAHLSRYARGLRRGGRVRQSRVIGYVGRSGLATGPHLHYEFRIHGVHRDPLRVHLPDAQPIAARYRPAFRRAVRPLLAQLDVLSRHQLALSD